MRHEDSGERYDVVNDKPPTLAEIPAYGVGVIDDPELGQAFAWLTVSTPLTTHQFYLANKNNYRQVAQALHDSIIKAGREMQKPRLAVAKGVNSDGLRQTQERQPARTSATRTTRTR